MQKGRASGEEARPFCIDLVLQGKTLCCWGMQQLANVCYERKADLTLWRVYRRGVGLLAYFSRHYEQAQLMFDH